MTVLGAFYICVSIVVNGMVPYYEIDLQAPLSVSLYLF